MDFKFFSAKTDKMINTIKSELFYVSGGAPIVGRDHPVVREMMALPAPVKNGITCMHPSPARTATARHARMRACLCTRTLRADHVFCLSRRVRSLRNPERRPEWQNYVLRKPRSAVPEKPARSSLWEPRPPRSTHVVSNMLHIVWDIVC